MMNPIEKNLLIHNIYIYMVFILLKVMTSNGIQLNSGMLLQKIMHYCLDGMLYDAYTQGFFFFFPILSNHARFKTILLLYNIIAMYNNPKLNHKQIIKMCFEICIHPNSLGSDKDDDRSSCFVAHSNCFPGKILSLTYN